MSPLVDSNIPTAIRSGNAFPYTGMIRPPTVTIGTNDRVIVLATNGGNSGTVFAQWFRGSALVTRTVGTIPTIALSDDLGGPTSGRAMKFSFGVVNTTSLFNRGGRVYSLTSDARIRIPSLPSTMTWAETNDLANAVVAHPDTVSYDGTHFGEAQHVVSHVVDSNFYNIFQPWLGTESFDEFVAHAISGPLSEPGTRPMSAHWFVFEPAPVANTYAFTARASYYTRWSVDTIPGQSHTAIPTAPPSTVNRIHEAAEKFSGVLQTVESISQAGVALMSTAQNAAGALSRARGMYALMPPGL